MGGGGEVVIDAGSDAGADAGVDGGSIDAGADAGRPDAGPPDASVDGGFDAGVPDAGCGCGALQCAGDGGCVECFANEHCPVNTPYCDAARNSCVECESAPVDTCGFRQFCANGSCQVGCKVAVECSSGICLSNRNCAYCESDTECRAGEVCATGTCAPPCSGANACDGGLACCGGKCTDVTADSLHCGQCDRICDAGTFCGRSDCRDVILSNVCESPRALALVDGYPLDDDAGVAIGTAIASMCMPAVSFSIASQHIGGVLHPDTGRPLGLGTLYVAGGGSFGHQSVQWAEQSGAAPIVDVSTGDQVQLMVLDGGLVVDEPLSALNEGHDFFVVQLAQASNGALLLNAYGFYAPGTLAAVWFVNNNMLPMRASYPMRWYVYEWVDANANQMADAADTFTLRGSGL